MSMPKKKHAVEDFNEKIELLQRYRRVFELELKRSNLSADERRRIQRDVELFASIDEDLIRLSAGVPAQSECYDRAANAELRDQILKFIQDADAHVLIADICAQFDMTADRARNLMRPLRRDGLVVYDGSVGFRALMQMPPNQGVSPRRLS